MGVYKRRVIRLQPMVVMGSVIGAAFFYLQKGPAFPLIATTPVWKVLRAMVVGATLIPLLPSMDIRGWSEMHPLDGPAWSLFFEYIANLLYGLGLRKLSKRALGVLVLLSAGLLVQYLLWGHRGDVIGGWAVDRTQMHIGFARMLYPFFAGVLLMRMGWRVHVRGAFAVCSALLVLVFAVPRIGGPDHVWVNGLYEAVCILLVFPLIVAMGAGDTVQGAASLKVCRALGGISYPLYITHYPLIYTYWSYVTRTHLRPAYGAVLGAGLLATALTVAYACLKLYDEPVRAWLSARFLARRAEAVPGSVAVPQ